MRQLSGRRPAYEETFEEMADLLLLGQLLLEQPSQIATLRRLDLAMKKRTIHQQDSLSDGAVIAAF